MTPRNYREAHVQGVQTATRVRSELAANQSAESGARVDVFRSIDERGIALLFRPLDGLLGLCLREPCPGILVTSRRPLAVQRFTAAHELGHLEMGHNFSLDDEDQVLRPQGSSQKMLQEIAANAFGAEFLMPKSLLRRTMERHGWDARDLADPLAVYQLSLRIGVSYGAICVSLLRHKWIDQQTSDRLTKMSPKRIKEHLLGGRPIGDPWADVWALTEADHDGCIEAGPNDVFLIMLREHGASGYLWNVEDLMEHGFTVTPHNETSKAEAVGSAVARHWKVSANFPSEGYLRLEERRPWQADEVMGRLHLAYSLWGRELGIPKSQRPTVQVA